MISARSPHHSLVAHHRQIHNGLTAVREHHRNIDRDPTRIMPQTPPPNQYQGIAEPRRAWSWLTELLAHC